MPTREYHYRVRPESITKTYTAKNLIDYADAHLSRYYYFMDEEAFIFKEKQSVLLMNVAKGFSKVWRWWYGCDRREKQLYSDRIIQFLEFGRSSFPLLGFRSWHLYLRASTVFMRSRSEMLMALLYFGNQLFRTARPDKANIA